MFVPEPRVRGAERSGFVRRMARDGVITTIARPGLDGLVDGSAGQSRMNSPEGLAADSEGNLYVADTGNNVVRKIFSDGRTITLAGTGRAGNQDGAATQATFTFPDAVAVDNFGNVYVAESGSNRVRKTSTQGFVSTLAGRPFNQYAPTRRRTGRLDLPD